MVSCTSVSVNEPYLLTPQDLHRKLWQSKCTTSKAHAPLTSWGRHETTTPEGCTEVFKASGAFSLLIAAVVWPGRQTSELCRPCVADSLQVPLEHRGHLTGAQPFGISFVEGRYVHFEGCFKSLRAKSFGFQEEVQRSKEGVFLSPGALETRTVEPAGSLACQQRP